MPRLYHVATNHRNYNIASTWRTKARTDPGEAHEIWSARHSQATADYLDGTLSRDTFAATLYGLGFRNSDLSSELAHYDRLSRAES